MHTARQNTRAHTVAHQLTICEGPGLIVQASALHPAIFLHALKLLLLHKFPSSTLRCFSENEPDTLE